MDKIFAVGILVLFPFARIRAYIGDMEPKCSKFDFEEKLLEKMIKLDHKTGLMMESLEDRHAKLQEELTMVKRELELKGKEFLSSLNIDLCPFICQMFMSSVAAGAL